MHHACIYVVQSNRHFFISYSKSFCLKRSQKLDIHYSMQKKNLEIKKIPTRWYIIDKIKSDTISCVKRLPSPLIASRKEVRAGFFLSVEIRAIQRERVRTPVFFGEKRECNLKCPFKIGSQLRGTDFRERTAIESRMC